MLQHGKRVAAQSCMAAYARGAGLKRGVARPCFTPMTGDESQDSLPPVGLTKPGSRSCNANELQEAGGSCTLSGPIQ